MHTFSLKERKWKLTKHSPNFALLKMFLKHFKHLGENAHLRNGDIKVPTENDANSINSVCVQENSERKYTQMLGDGIRDHLHFFFILFLILNKFYYT